MGAGVAVPRVDQRWLGDAGAAHARAVVTLEGTPGCTVWPLLELQYLSWVLEYCCLFSVEPFTRLLLRFMDMDPCHCLIGATFCWVLLLVAVHACTGVEVHSSPFSTLHETLENPHSGHEQLHRPPVPSGFVVQ